MKLHLCIESIHEAMWSHEAIIAMKPSSHRMAWSGGAWSGGIYTKHVSLLFEGPVLCPALILSLFPPFWKFLHPHVSTKDTRKSSRKSSRKSRL